MADVTVKDFAEQIHTPVERLLEQLAEAGVEVSRADDALSSEQKMQLLAYLRREHGEDAQAEPRRITLKRRSVSELKIAGGQGRTKTVNVEVRRKRTYVKRAAVIEQEKQRIDAARKEREAEEAKREAEEKARQEAIERKRQEEEERLQQEAEERERETRRREEEERERVQEEERRKAEAEARREEEEERKRLERALHPRHGKTTTTGAPTQPAPGAPISGELHVKRSGRGRRPARAAGGRKRQARVVNVETQHGGFQQPVEQKKKVIGVPEAISVNDLAQRMAVKGTEVVKALMGMGTMATINQVLDQDTAALVVEEMGHEAKLESPQDVESQLLATEVERGEEKSRSPVVTVMGHVDHGKTSLLDYIRSTKVTSREAGGITQHIGAYHVDHKKGGITFLDTPGHAAFTAIRARGAKSTDVVILVVAADDGVMPQTIEAIEHARAAGVPIVVAVNKMDKPEADPDRVKSELAQHELVPEDWGGDAQFVAVSAKTGEGIDDLLDAVLLQSELLELKASPDGPARGVVLESRLDKGRGAVATLLIQEGTLKRGDMLLAGSEFGRVRAMLDDSGATMKSAGPSMPVQVLGLSGTPEAGDEAMVVEDERRAREVASHRETRDRQVRLASQQAGRLDEMFNQMGQDETKVLNLIIKADVHGSLEAVRDGVTRMSSDEAQVKIVSSGIGGITESDLNLATASNAVILGFNVRADNVARKAQQEAGVDIRYYSVIYELIDDVRKALSGMLSPELREQIVGLAEVRDVFRSPKFGAVAGCLVVDGYVRRDNPIRVLRDNVVIFEGTLESLRRFKDDVKEVRAGTECGIAVKDYDDVREGDQIECFERVEVAREIEA
ncbi:MAG TPA: translation initiation factor IF-2 [Gammaproteobacteria bacterium]|nr:translation initiation factor IF-2 [Gammaproteobacteria bacterium]